MSDSNIITMIFIILAILAVGDVGLGAILK